MDAKDCGPVYQLPPKSYGKLKMPQTVQNYSEDSLVSTQFRASPFERALFSALNRVSLKN